MITLRGLTGADFEGEARVKRGHGMFAIFSFCSGERAWKSVSSSLLFELFIDVRYSINIPYYSTSMIRSS